MVLPVSIGAITATASIPTATATAAATAAILARTGFVNSECAAFEILAVEFANGSLHTRLVTHGDKGESSWPTGIAIHDDRYFADISMNSEGFAEFEFIDFVGKVPHVHFRVLHLMLFAGSDPLLLRCSRESGLKITTEY